MMDAQLLAQLQQTVHVAKVVPDGLGGYTRMNERNLPARVVGRMRLIRDAQGAEVVSDYQFVTIEAISLDERIWLPGANTADLSQSRIPKAIIEQPDERGQVDFWEVFV